MVFTVSLLNPIFNPSTATVFYRYTSYYELVRDYPVIGYILLNRSIDEDVISRLEWFTFDGNRTGSNAGEY
jgi:hypothetical protein